MCFCHVIRDPTLLEVTMLNSNVFPDSHSTLKFRLKLHQASCLHNRKQAVSVHFTFTFDDPQTKPSVLYHLYMVIHTRIRDLWTPIYFTLSCKVSAHSRPAGADTANNVKRQERQMVPLQPNVLGPQTKPDLHLHVSQQRLLTLTSSNNSAKSTSNKPTAIERATPVERKGLFPWVTGHGSLCSSPSKSVKFMSILCTGCRNLQKSV